MAVRTFYGTCKTASGESEKKVYVPDLDLTAENNGFNFQEGDLLVVFFAQTNTVSEPSIVVYIQDPEVETSTTDDTGKYIKSLDVEANMENAWAAGETVIFAYTQQSTSDTYYWELIDANHASVETYGDTKLFDEERLENLLNGEVGDKEGSETALTPNSLKKFFDLLRNEQSEDPAVESPFGLHWDPTTQGEEQTLGYLSLSQGLDESNRLEITYPIEAKIQEYIRNNPTITHTGQLINNGNGNKPNDKTNPDTEPFITRIIPDDLYFGTTSGLYYGVPSNENEGGSEGGEESATPTSQPRIILNDENNYLVLGDNSDNTLAGIIINKPTEINGNEQVNGTLTTTGDISAGSSLISTSGNIKSDVLYEDFDVSDESKTGVPLNEKYSGKLQVIRVASNIHTISAKTSLAHATVSANAPSGYTPIGIVGWNVDYAGSKDNGDAKLTNIWECFITGSNIQYALYNISTTQSITVKVYFYVLYKRNV